MAKSTDFEGANDVLRAPAGVTQDECGDLPIFRAPGSVVSCWRLSPEEIEYVNRTGCVWFQAMGTTHPPILIAGEPLVIMVNTETGEQIGDVAIEPATKKAPRKDNS